MISKPSKLGQYEEFIDTLYYNYRTRYHINLNVFVLGHSLDCLKCSKTLVCVGYCMSNGKLTYDLIANKSISLYSEDDVKQAIESIENHCNYCKI